MPLANAPRPELTDTIEADGAVKQPETVAQSSPQAGGFKPLAGTPRPSLTDTIGTGGGQGGGQVQPALDTEGMRTAPQSGYERAQAMLAENPDMTALEAFEMGATDPKKYLKSEKQQRREMFAARMGDIAHLLGSGLSLSMGGLVPEAPGYALQQDAKNQSARDKYIRDKQAYDNARLQAIFKDLASNDAKRAAAAQMEFDNFKLQYDAYLKRQMQADKAAADAAAADRKLDADLKKIEAQGKEGRKGIYAREAAKKQYGTGTGRRYVKSLTVDGGNGRTATYDFDSGTFDALALDAYRNIPPEYKLPGEGGKKLTDAEIDAMGYLTEDVKKQIKKLQSKNEITNEDRIEYIELLTGSYDADGVGAALNEYFKSYAESNGLQPTYGNIYGTLPDYGLDYGAAGTVPPVSGVTPVPHDGAQPAAAPQQAYGYDPMADTRLLPSVF